MSIEIGSILEGVVTGIMPFGAFVELPERKSGLVHISEIADVYVNNVSDFLKVGQQVKVKVLTIDERGKIGLSIKRLNETAARPVSQPPRPPRTFERAPRPPERSGNGGNEAGIRPPGAAPRYSGRPGGGGRGFGSRYSNAGGPPTFEDKLSRFLKDSDERLTDLRRKTDAKRGGRGSRRG